jgi:hypothetical protein
MTQSDVERVFNDDDDYARAQSENGALREKITATEESIAGANFRIT